jgi:hypothetical protein
MLYLIYLLLYLVITFLMNHMLLLLFIPCEIHDCIINYCSTILAGLELAKPMNYEF